MKWSEVAQSCPTLRDPMASSLPGSSIHGILDARILEWVAISFSRRSFRPRDRTQVSCIAGRCFTLWATREAPNKAKPIPNYLLKQLWISMLQKEYLGSGCSLLKSQSTGQAGGKESVLYFRRLQLRRVGWWMSVQWPFPPPPSRGWELL